MGPSKDEQDVTPPSAARFQTTHWSRILLAQDPTNPQAKEALSALCETYCVTVAHPEEIDAEVRHLFEVLGS